MFQQEGRAPSSFRHVKMSTIAAPRVLSVAAFGRASDKPGGTLFSMSTLNVLRNCIHVSMCRAICCFLISKNYIPPNQNIWKSAPSLDFSFQATAGGYYQKYGLSCTQDQKRRSSLLTNPAPFSTDLLPRVLSPGKVGLLIRRFSSLGFGELVPHFLDQSLPFYQICFPQGGTIRFMHCRSLVSYRTTIVITARRNKRF